MYLSSVRGKVVAILHVDYVIVVFLQIFLVLKVYAVSIGTSFPLYPQLLEEEITARLRSQIFQVACYATLYHAFLVHWSVGWLAPFSLLLFLR